jgi:hypothetical protein
MLKFIAANLQPPDSPLGRAILASHAPRTAFSATARVGLLWGIHTTRFNRTFVWHNGGTAGYRSYVGFDPARGVGVVVLSNRSNSVDRVGMHLLDPRNPVSTAGIERGFHLLPLTLAGLLVVAVFVSWRRTGATRGRAVLAATAMTAGLLAWMGGTYLAAAFGLLRFDTRPPTMMLLVPVLLFVSVGLGVSPVGRRLALGIPLWILVGVQSFRLPLELLMHEAYESGLMPRQMSFSGLNFDIVTGASALVVAMLVMSGRAGSRLVALWNVVGTVLLCNIIIVSMLSTPTPLRVFRTQPANTWITSPPYIWLPAVLVAFAILGHVVVYRALRARRVILHP